MSDNNQNIFSNLEKYNNKIALYENDRISYSYRDILKFGNEFKYLKREKSLILILCDNTFETVSTYINLIRLNQTVFLLSNNLEKNFFLNIIKKYYPKYLFLSKNYKINFVNKFYKINKEFKNNIFYEFKKKVNYKIYKNLSLLLMTSGSTGSPQTVRISNQNLKSNTEAICNYFKINSNDRAITTLPMNYTLGLSIINTHLNRGASITLTNYSLVQKEFLDLLNKNKITTFTGVPFTFEVLKRTLPKKGYFSHLKYITQAGGKLDSNLAKYFENLFSKNKIKLYLMYGQTEATARMSILNYKKLYQNPESIGNVIRGGKFFLIDDNKKLIKKNNTIGELIYKGKNVSLGYANSFLDLNTKDKNFGVLKTGDLSYKDKNNLFFIVGRKKRFIKINGVRINLDSVEYVLKQKNLECACKGVDDKLEIYITKHNFSEKVFRKTLKKLNIRFTNVKLFKINKIPRNRSGKIIYNDLSYGND